MKIIDLEDFIQQVLEECCLPFIYYVIMIEDYPPKIQSSSMAQISSAITEIIIFSEAYKDFKEVFLLERASCFSPYKDQNHAINLIDSKQPPYRPIL